MSSNGKRPSQSRPTRKRAVPNSLKDYHYVRGDTNEEWFRVHCISNNRRYIINAKKLDTIGGEPFDPENARVGDHALWNTNGKAYEIEIKAKARSKEILAEHEKRSIGKYEEDSSESSSEYENLMPMNKKSNCNDSDHEDDFINPVLAEDGSFAGHSKDLDKESNSVDTEILQAIKEDVHYLKEKYDTMSQRIEKMYHLVKHQTAAKYIPKTDSPNRVNAKIDLPRAQIFESATTTSIEDDSRSTLNDDERKFTYNNTNLLHVHGKDCYKYALALMDILFTKEEMASSCFYATGRSKKVALPQDKVQLIEECIDMKYGKGTVSKNREDFKSRLNQKCIDQRKTLTTKTEEKKQE